VRSLAGPLTKLAIFALVTILASYVLVSTITNAGYGEQVTYQAQFTDVAGLVEGDEVRIAGVRVGQVTGIGLSSDKEKPVAEVELQVEKDVPLPAAVQATIRYRNLVGQRYIALTEGQGSAGRTLAANGVIPLKQTHPALDLTTLFGGFQPHVASLSSSLADKDQVIGSVIDNLTKVLGTVAARDQQLNDLIISLQQFVSGLAADKDAIFNSLQTVDTLAGTTAGLLEQARPPLAADIQQLQVLAGNVAAGGDQLQQFLQLAPTKLDLITRTAINGSWFNFFLCGASGFLVLPGTDPSTTNGITVPAGGLNSGEAGCS
jgi:phospholipid/cholesterol/gamma-HCH transport system substrate-binding protein